MKLTHHTDDRPDITTVERDRVIARMDALHNKSTDVNDRFYRVARRLQYWLAGVENSAQWLALFDCIKHDYIRWRIDDSETIHHLRWLGIDVRNGDTGFFGKDAEMARRANATKLKAQCQARFDAVKWELDFNRRKAVNE